MLDEYEKYVGHPELALVTGKPIEKGGSLGRDTATGDGGFIVLQELMKKLKRTPKETRVAIQGVGNVGYSLAIRLFDAGYRIIGLSDSKGGIVDKQGHGMDPKNVMKTKEEQGFISGCYCVGSVCDCENYAHVSNAQFLELPCDVLVPAALENQFTQDNAARVKAGIILELANGPTTPEADAIFRAKNVIVVPDILANAGGVAVSYFEWAQNMQKETWTREKVQTKLEETMLTALHEVWKAHEANATDLRTAAFIVALERIVAAMKHD